MTSRRRSILLVVLVGIASAATFAAACGSDPAVSVEDAGVEGGAAQTDATRDVAVDREPGRALPPGRPVAIACASRVRSAGVVLDAGTGSGDLAPDASDRCLSDEGCNADAGERCGAPWCYRGDSYHSFGARCTQDACTSDQECGPTGVCGCGVGFQGQHVCLRQGNCRTNADCGSDQICGYSYPYRARVEGTIVCPYGEPPIVDGTESGVGVVNAGAALGWFCTTPRDACSPGEPTEGGPSGRCAYYPGSQSWNFDIGP